MGAGGPSTRQRATPREVEDIPTDTPFPLLSAKSAPRPPVQSTQTKLMDVRTVLREMPWMADYITDTGLPALLRSGLDGAQDTPHASLPGFHDEHPVFLALPAIDVQVHTMPLRVTEQAPRTIDPAAGLYSEHHTSQESPATSLPVICE